MAGNGGSEKCCTRAIIRRGDSTALVSQQFSQGHDLRVLCIRQRARFEQ